MGGPPASAFLSTHNDYIVATRCVSGAQNDLAQKYSGGRSSVPDPALVLQGPSAGFAARLPLDPTKFNLRIISRTKTLLIYLIATEGRLIVGDHGTLRHLS